MAKKKKDDKAVHHGLDQALANIEKLYGKGTVMSMKDKPVDVEVVSSGSLKIDRALRVKGYPRGRVIEIYGPESAGKSTIALHLVAEVQRLIRAEELEGRAAYLDVEQALDPRLAESLGVDMDDLLFSQPDYGEQALEVTEELVRSGGCPIVVVDSVAALVPKAELDGNMGDSLPGLQARLMSQALRKLVAYTWKSKTIVVFINQTRQKIGVMFGNPETTTGGNALKFYASIRVEARIIGSIKKGEDRIGNKLRIKIVKNKLAAPFAECEVDLIYGHGIDQVCETLDLALEFDVIEKSGNWHSYGGERIGNGRDATVLYLRDHPDDVASMRETIAEKLEFV